MTNTNDFLPFATAGGADVLDQSDYASLPSRSQGFVAGIADPPTVNKVWRQSSIVAAMVAQFTADYGPGNVVDDGNIPNLEAQFVAALKSFVPEAGLLHYGVAGGSANAITVTATPGISALVGGITLLVKLTATNTAATTITPNSLGTVSIVRPDGSALLYGDLENGAVAILIYDGTHFQLAGSMFLSNDLEHYGVDTSASANTITLTSCNPPCLAYQAGTTFRVKIANSNTGNTTLQAPGLGIESVKTPSGSSLVGGELLAGSVVTFVFDGTQFYIQTSQATNTNTSTGGLTTVATSNPIYGTGVTGAPVAIYDGSQTQKGAWRRATSLELSAGSSTTIVTPADLANLPPTVINQITTTVQNGPGVWQTFEHDFTANPLTYWSIDMTAFGTIMVRSSVPGSPWIGFLASGRVLTANDLLFDNISSTTNTAGKAIGLSPSQPGTLYRIPGTNNWAQTTYTMTSTQTTVLNDGFYQNISYVGGSPTSVSSTNTSIGAIIQGLGNTLVIAPVYGTGTNITSGKMVIHALPLVTF